METKKVRLNLVDLDSNAFSLLGAARKATAWSLFSSVARRQGWSKEEIAKVRTEAMAGDYDHLLCVLMDHTEDDANDLL